jgi:hypothetical protein
MRPEKDIEDEVMKLQSEVASYDELLNLNRTKPTQVTSLTYYRAYCLTKIHVLEWVLGREPSL